MWGWLDGIVDWLGSIWETVRLLPSVIYGDFSVYLDDFTRSFTTIKSGLVEAIKTLQNGFISLGKTATDTLDKIKDLPTMILQGIKDIFIPDYKEINASTQNFIEELSLRFGFQGEFLKDFFTNEQTIEDTKVDYNIPGVGVMNLTLFETYYLKQGLIYFRPFIRGFLIMMMAFFSVRMTLSFIRQDAGVVAGKAVSHSTKKED